MVTWSYLTTAAPKIWWRFGGRDPLIGIFVPAGAVLAGSWTGYHFLGPSAGWLLPWPLSLAAHSVLPWFIVKAPAGAGTAGSTRNATHELVEAVTDPLPLSANVDFTKSPPWVGGEIADICSVGTPSGIQTTTRFTFTVPTFWSNAAGACVG